MRSIAIVCDFVSGPGGHLRPYGALQVPGVVRDERLIPSLLETEEAQ